MTVSTDNEYDDQESLIARIVDEFTDRLNQGEHPDVDAYVQTHPQIADDLRQLLGPLQAMHKSPAATRSIPPESNGAELKLKGLGEYHIIRELGRGGMAVVYEAEHHHLRRRVALKVLPEHLTDETFIRRFEREARAAANLHHTHIVPVYETGVADGRHFIAMQYIVGRSLDKVIKERRQKNVPVAGGQSDATVEFDMQHHVDTSSIGSSPGSTELAPPSETTRLESKPDAQQNNRIDLLCTISESRYFAEVARIISKAADALAYAHERRVLHRDIKPANLLLDENAEVWVSDFGLAKIEDDNLTGTGDIVGTLRYMAPERFQGECDPRSDVYALGVTLYEMLTLRPVFDESDRLLLIKRVTDAEPIPPRRINAAIPRDLETICLKCLQKEPSKRYRNADGAADDLRACLAGRPIQARRVGVSERAVKLARRHPLATALACVTISALVAFVIVLIVSNQQIHHSNQELQIRGRELKESNEQLKVSEKSLKATVGLLNTSLANEKKATEKFKDSLHFALMGLASKSAAANEMAAGEGQLDQCPPDRRGLEWHYLKRICRTELSTFGAAGQSMHGFAFGPKGKLIAVTNYYHHNDPNSRWGQQWRVRLYDVAGGRELRHWTGSGSRAAVAIDPEAKRLAILSVFATPKDRNIEGLRIWNLETGALLTDVAASASQVREVVFTPDGRHVIGMSRDATRIWEAKTGKLLANQPTPMSLASAISPDRSCYVVADTKTRRFDLRETDTGKVIGKSHLLRSLWPAIAVHPQNTFIAFGDRNSVQIWDVRQQRFARRLPAKVYHNNPTLAFDPSGKLLALAEVDKTVTVWDWQAQRKLKTFRGHLSSANYVAFSPDGRLLASAGRHVKLWDPNADTEFTRVPIPRLSAAVSSNVVLSPKGRYFAVRVAQRGKSTQFSIHKTRTGKVVSSFQTEREIAASPALSEDGRLLAATWNKKTGIWDGRTGQKINTIADERPYFRACFHPESTALACLGGDRNSSFLRIHHLNSGRKQILKAPEKATYLVFDALGKQIAVAGADSVTKKWHVKVWNLDNGRQFAAEGAGTNVVDLAFSPDCRRIAMSCRDVDGDRKLHVLDIARSAELPALHLAHIWRFAFSPDGKYLAYVATEEKSFLVRIVDAETGIQISELRGHGGSNGALAFSQRGDRIATVANDTVKVWHPLNGQELLSLPAPKTTHQVFVTAEDQVVAISYDEVRIWNGAPVHDALASGKNP